MKVETYRIKNGVAAHDEETKLTAHGYNEEVAKANLEHTVMLYYRALERGSKLEAQLAKDKED